MRTATYVYCLVASATKPRARRTLKGVRHSGAVRILPLDRRLWLVVGDVPLARYGERALKAGMSDLEWVSEIALAHESVVEAFLSADAVLPMKLFTIFDTDERARGHVAKSRESISELVVRVTRKDEWGLRVAMSRPGAFAIAAGGKATDRSRASGSSYLLRKKAQRDEVLNRARRARAVAADVFDTVATHAAEARRRPATELPAGGGPLVLDAAFLVPRSRATRLKAAVARQARSLAPEGYAVSLTGPWPPYSFMQD